MSPDKKPRVTPRQPTAGGLENREELPRPKRRSGQKRRVPKETLAWAAERDGKTPCACGCGLPVWIKWFHRYGRGVPRFVHGHNQIGQETPASKWIRENQGRHVCQCGCGGVIPIKIHHHTRGVPRYLNHHSVRVVNHMRGRYGPASTHYKGGRNKTPTGYINILVGSEGGRPIYVLEHRLVMEKVLGRKLRKGESVHHKNGLRDDNRPSNLELWRSNHPGGQRVEDLLSFAVSVIRDHAGDPNVWPKREKEILRRIAKSIKKTKRGLKASSRRARTTAVPRGATGTTCRRRFGAVAPRGATRPAPTTKFPATLPRPRRRSPPVPPR